MYVVGIVLIAGFAVLMVCEMQRAATPYVTRVDSLAGVSGKKVQFKGAIVHPKTSYNAANHELRFALKDDAGKLLQVRYDGPKPGNFDTADVAVVRGIYADNSLRANDLRLKCPSKYEGQK